MKKETWLKVQFNGDDDFIYCGLEDVEFRINNMDTLDKAIEVVKERLLELREHHKDNNSKVEFIDSCIGILKNKFDMAFYYSGVDDGNWQFDISIRRYIETNFERRKDSLRDTEILEIFPEFIEEYKKEYC